VFLLEQQQVEVVFLSAKSSSVLRRSSFVVKGKERFKNETLSSRVFKRECECEEALIELKQRSEHDTNNDNRHRSETMSFDQKPMEPVETFLRPSVSSRVSSGFFLLGTKFRGRVESEKREDKEDEL